LINFVKEWKIWKVNFIVFKYNQFLDVKEQRNTSYCLSQLKYNEKALRTLTDKYEYFRHLLKDKTILENFINITTKK